jgi:hypothetical protein
MVEITAVEQDIDVRLKQAGIVVPADLRAGVVREAADLLRMAALLRGPRTAAAEPFSATWPESGE